MAVSKDPWEEYDPYSNLNFSKKHSKNHNVHMIKRDDVIRKMVIDYMQADGKAPTEFLAHVRKIITYDDKHISNVDPFYNTTDDRERMHEAGKISNFSKRIYAQVEIPSFYTEISNLDMSYLTEYAESLLKVDITNTEEKRKVRSNQTN